MCSHLDFSVTNLLYINITRYFQELSAIVSTDAVICTLCQFVGHYNALPRTEEPLHTFQWGEKQISSFTIQPSEIRGLCLTKLSSKMLQNLLYLMYKKTHAVSFLFFFLPLWMPWSMSDQGIHKWKTSRFWSISLDQFVENRLLTYEEWSSQMEHVLWSYNHIYLIYYTLQVTTIQVHLSVCCLFMAASSIFFQNCWAVVENCTRTSSNDWRYYYWVQKSKTKQIKMVVKLWLRLIGRDGSCAID